MKTEDSTIAIPKFHPLFFGNFSVEMDIIKLPGSFYLKVF